MSDAFPPRPLRCVCGDSTQETTWRDALGQEKADALITDPPYCLLTRRRRGGDKRDPKHRKIDSGPVFRFEDVKSYRAFTAQWLSLAVEHVAPHARLVIWTNLLGREPIRRVAHDLGYSHLVGEFVWAKKTRASNSGEEILRVVETALVLSRSPTQSATNASPATPWAAVAGYDDDGEGARWGSHPNHKPFGVLEPLVRTWSALGDLVIDPFAGSGSISAAALRLGRRSVCIEREPEWAQRVHERITAVSLASDGVNAPNTSRAANP